MIWRGIARRSPDCCSVATHHLLVIDDEPYIGRIVRMQFERGPYQVAVYTDARAALDYLTEHPDVDIILMDLNMPGMSGLVALEAMRQDPRFAETRVVVLTAAGQAGHVERARELGALAVITKPFSPKKLYREVATLLGDSPEPADLGGGG